MSVGEAGSGPCDGWMLLPYLAPPLLAALLIVATPPGRWLVRNRFNWPISNRISWCLKELPSLAIPAWHLYHSGGSWLLPPLLPLTLFAGHYLHRSLVYPWRVSADSREPLAYVAAAAAFTAWNGQLQSVGALSCAADSGAVYTARHLIGGAVFTAGAVVNVDSDRRLLRLRRPGGPRYSIPRGGLFERVTAANYLGEVVEWWGYALVAWSPPALLFAVFTTVYLTGCAASLHERNRALFGAEYPPRRRRIFPYIF